jgi:tetratricopeptide (TPR) repeat protein
VSDADLEALAAADEVIARLASPADAEEREEAAAAMRGRARALERLGRTDEALAAFAALAARFGDASEARVRGLAARALFSQARLLARSGAREDAIALYGEAVERFGDDPDALPDHWVAGALRNRALALVDLGRHEEALAAYDVVTARFSATGDDRVGEVLVMALANRVASLLALDRPDAAAAAADEARAAYDRHVAGFGEATDGVRAEMLRAVLNHVVAVWGDGRDPRVLAVYEDAIALARPAPPAQVRSAVFSALLSYASALSNLGFGARANALPAVVAELFGGDPDEDEEREPPPPDEPPDEELAGLLAAVFGGDAWGWFAAPDRDRPTDRLAARAVDLYERTGVVIDGLAGDRDLDSPGAAAALLVRTVANGCAILARSGAVAPHTRALLPLRSRMELGVRMLGIDRWAADQGHLLDLAPVDEELELELGSPGESEGGVEGFPAAFAAAVRTADIVAAARRSPAAAELLAGAAQRDRAADGVARAVHWAAWLEPRRPEAAPAAVAMMLLAQGVFCATWSAAPAAAWFPSRDLLRQAVEAADVSDWFDDAGVLLSEWLRDP